MAAILAKEILLKVQPGALVPANEAATAALRDMGLKMGQVVRATIRLQRNPGFYRLAHALARLVVESVPEFAEMDGHGALKRLQVESGAGCDDTPTQVAGQWVLIRIPRSLAFATIDETEFREIFRDISDYVAATYWPDSSGEAVRKMAEAMPDF
jgi:hypothetical protein